jgi:hypothetical protein
MRKNALVLLSAWFWAVSCASGGATSRQTDRPTRDVTFLVTSDCHYDAFENEDRNARNRDTVTHMNAIAGVSWPADLGGGNIGRPRGVLVLGDMVDDGDRAVDGNNQPRRQWAFYVGDFGLDGNDALLKYRVSEAWGNHDGPPVGKERLGFSVQAQLKKRNELRREKGWLTGLSDSGLHCSWDWDDVHFVQLGLYPADKQNPKVRYSPVWHDPQGALSFLKQDLARHVGSSGRPVVLMSHCGFDTNWWDPEDWKAAYEVMNQYNVVLYLYGHTGTGLRRWAPEGESKLLDCVNTGQTENGFFVVQIQGNRVRLAYRTKHYLQETSDDGRPKRKWDGTWEWKHALDKKIPPPLLTNRPAPEPARALAETVPSTAPTTRAATTAAGDGQEVSVIDVPDTSLTNEHYPCNRPPLLPSPLTKLPIGAVTPRGWLRTQLELEANGFTGRLTEISPYLRQQGNAWLSPDGNGHGGWEELPYWFRGYVMLGHVLGDRTIIEASRPYIENLLASQRPSGYFGTASNLREGKGDPDLMPNMSMLSALGTHYEATGDGRVLDLMRKYFRWELSIPDGQFFAKGWQYARTSDNLSAVYWLYNRTGEKWLLELGEKLFRCGARWTHPVTGGHNVDYSQGFRKPAQFYQQSRDPNHLRIAVRNWESMMETYGQVPGGLFGGDEFARPGCTDPRQAIESCGIVEMMRSEIILLGITGEAVWADRCENAALNTLPACMTADLKALRYLTSPNQVNSDKRSKSPGLANGGPMQVMNPHSHRCCQHNVGMGWPFYAQHLWMAAPGNGLAAVFYCDSVVRAKVGPGVEARIEESTAYPFGEKVELALTVPQPVRFPLYLRVPGWCRRPAAKLNGRDLPGQGKPGAYLVIDRLWSSGDRVELSLPMPPTVRTWEKNSNAVSVNLGPVTFSLKIGEKHVRSGGTDAWPAWEIVPTTPWNYGLLLDGNDPAASFEVVRRPAASSQPFQHEGVPIELRARARRIPTWTEDHRGLVAPLQPSPVKSDEPVETVTLIPMGAARLRISAFPVIGDGPSARLWATVPPPMASFERGGGRDPIEAINDGKVPASSFDPKTPRFTWYDRSELGKTQWVQQNLDGEKLVSSCEVYWFDETPVNAVCRVPKSWRLLHKDGQEWKEVKNPGPYGLETDKFNVVRFDPVKTTAMRVEVQCQPNRSAGIYEWRIK